MAKAPKGDSSLTDLSGQSNCVNNNPTQQSPSPIESEILRLAATLPTVQNVPSQVASVLDSVGRGLITCGQFLASLGGHKYVVIYVPSPEASQVQA